MGAGAMQDETRKKGLSDAVAAVLNEPRHRRTMARCAPPRAHHDTIVISTPLPGVPIGVWFAIKFAPSGTVFLSVDHTSDDVNPNVLVNLRALLSSVARYVKGDLGKSAMERDATLYVERAAIAVAEARAQATPEDRPAATVAAKEALRALTFVFEGGQRQVMFGPEPLSTVSAASTTSEVVDATAPDPDVLRDLFECDTSHKFVAFAGDASTGGGMTFEIPTIQKQDVEEDEYPVPYVLADVDDAIEVRICGATDAVKADAESAHHLLRVIDRLATLMKDRSRNRYRTVGPVAATVPEAIPASESDDVDDDPDFALRDEEDYVGPEDIAGEDDTAEDWDDVPLALRARSANAAKASGSRPSKRPGEPPENSQAIVVPSKKEARKN